MSSKADRFYFENLTQAADCACKASAYLAECLANFNADELPKMLEQMHELEHEGDTKKHEMSAALAKAFVTPIDREDIALLSQTIDDVTDKIEEVLQLFYMDHIAAIPSEAAEFARNIARCCQLMKEMLEEFSNFKKPAKLHQMIIDLSHVEEECDRLYLIARANITNHASDPLDVVSWREILDGMEDCADACEHVGDCVETVIMKNT